MDQILQEVCAELRQLTDVARPRLEAADEVLIAVNVLVDQLAQSELLNETALLGRIIDVQPNRQDGRLLQAALLVPGGLGIVVWDAAEYWAMRNRSRQPGRRMFIDFLPLDLCDTADKELLLPQVRPLLDCLCRKLRHLYRDAEDVD